MKKNKGHVAWPLTIFILSILVAILGIVKKDYGVTFLLLSIFLIQSATFIKLL